MAMRDSQRLEPAMLDAFEEQMTEDSFRSVLEYARRRVGPDEAMVAACDAITDTLTGVARWQPTSGALGAHLRRAIGRGEPDDELDAPPRWQVGRREVFDLLDFARVRLELAWRELRDQARAARAARQAARAIAIGER